MRQENEDLFGETYFNHYARGSNDKADPRAMAASFAPNLEATYGSYVNLLPPGSRVLDLGCGTGYLLLWLSSKGLVASGVDQSPSMVKVARRVSAGHGNSPRRRFGLPPLASRLLLVHLLSRCPGAPPHRRPLRRMGSGSPPRPYSRGFFYLSGTKCCQCDRLPTCDTSTSLTSARLRATPSSNSWRRRV